MADGVRSRHGFLVLADISGYTAFFAGAELEHAQAIIHELTTLIRERLAPPLRFVKLEGDAVFCHAEEAAVPDGERLVELIERCYFDFSNRLQDMVRTTTCQCAACATMSTLDLKFIAHFGGYAVQTSGSSEDLAGPDVILAHRFLKNGITDQLGVAAYAFFTDACLQRLPAAFELPRHAEKLEAFGETGGGVHDLAPVLREMREQRRLYIAAGEADLEARLELPYPPPVVWRYVVDPVERLRWACRLFDRNPDALKRNTRGRTGAGASSHCGHGPTVATREYVDWRPFDYFTCRTTLTGRLKLTSPRPAIETIEFTPLDDGGTRIEQRIRIERHSGISKLWFWVSMRALRGRVDSAAAMLKAIIEEDAEAITDGAEMKGTP